MLRFSVRTPVRCALVATGAQRPKDVREAGRQRLLRKDDDIVKFIGAKPKANSMRAVAVDDPVGGYSAGSTPGDLRNASIWPERSQENLLLERFTGTTRVERSPAADGLLRATQRRSPLGDSDESSAGVAGDGMVGTDLPAT
jgi:hypothetical protein